MRWWHGRLGTQLSHQGLHFYGSIFVARFLLCEVEVKMEGEELGIIQENPVQQTVEHVIHFLHTIIKMLILENYMIDC